MRKLASIQTILSLSPIEGADKIEVATILGWQCVVKKGEFAVGDKCIYCEVDSLFPVDKPEYEFLKSKGYRIKTIRLRGQISQGIAFPLSILKTAMPHGWVFADKKLIIKNLDTLQEMKVEDDLDVTELLGITKWEPPIPASLGGTAKGNFPAWLVKSDETRVQILQHLLDKYKGTVCYIAEKLDGSSATFYIKDGVFGVCSRNIDLIETEDNTFWKVAREMDIENKLRSLGINCAIQGELIGEGIQKNKYKLRGQQVHFFNFFDIDKFEYAGYEKFTDIIMQLGLIIVPIISDNYVLETDINALVKLSIGKSVLNPDMWREGIVIRPLNETIESQVVRGLLKNDRVSFKAINPEFLIEFGE